MPQAILGNFLARFRVSDSSNAHFRPLLSGLMPVSLHNSVPVLLHNSLTRHRENQYSDELPRGRTFIVFGGCGLISVVSSFFISTSWRSLRCRHDHLGEGAGVLLWWNSSSSLPSLAFWSLCFCRLCKQPAKPRVGCSARTT